jgi:formate/nitrite transporter FocA (FNT family)
MRPRDGEGAKERDQERKHGVDPDLYGREVMERIIDTIDVKRALHQRFFLRYMLRAAMAGIIICLMCSLCLSIKTDLAMSSIPPSANI